MENLFQLFYETTGVSTDTRKIKQDSLYIALKGENFDGNKFATKAIELGAKYAIVETKDFANENSIFYVENTLVFLQKLANFHRKKYEIPLIGITGSNGKTTSKELINAVLKTRYNVLCTEGNLNNHIGVPLTLLHLNATHEIAIIEMGANKPKDIEELCLIAEPNYGIITNVGKAHLEGFVTFEGVINTKSELYSAIKLQNGILVVNDDDEILSNKVKALPLEYYKYGTKSNVNVKGELLKLTPFVEFQWSTFGYSSPSISTNLVGKYNFYNFLAAITFGIIFKVEFERINKAIADYFPTNNRSQVQKTSKNTLIIDCYNANPSSMLLALESFREIDNNNKIAILGDMFELGVESNLEHKNVIDFCQKHAINYITIGSNFKQFNPNGYLTTTDFISNNQELLENKLILLKGSRGVALEKLIEIL